jgi:hypothetical protein
MMSGKPERDEAIAWARKYAEGWLHKPGRT